MSAVQLRLGFDEPTAPVTLMLSANGLRVVVECSSGLVNDAHAYLTAAGLRPEMSTTQGLTFPVSQFTDLASLSESVTVFADPVLRPLLEWVEYPSDDGMAAELDLGADGTLWMRWISAGRPLIEPLSSASVVALVAADIPFVASTEAFEALRSIAHIPLVAGRCRVNRAGFIDIDTSKPQLLEAADLPGLFRVDDTRYGLPFSSLPQLNATGLFSWEGPPLQLERGPRQLPPMPARLSTHVASDLRPLVDALAAYRTQVVVWDSGLGRRVFVLAALLALDAFPALVVCRPERVWQWWRHAQLFSRTAGVDNDTSDLRISTYEEFVNAPSQAYFAQTLVFDDIDSPAAASPEVAAAAVGIGGMLDCYLIGISDHLPADPKQLVGVMARLRPAEFQPQVALMDRYGSNLRQRLDEHVSAYVSRRATTDPGHDGTAASFNHTQVWPLEPGRELARELADLGRTLTGPDRMAAEVEMVTSGSRLTVSPKVATAADLATTALDSGRRVAVVSAHPRTVTLLSGLLRPHQPARVPADGVTEVPHERLVLVEGMDQLPDLTWFDEVIIVDYPVSYTDLDTAVGTADSANAPGRVTLLHLCGTIDDQLALLAARNADRGTRDRLPAPSAPIDAPAVGY